MNWKPDFARPLILTGFALSALMYLLSGPMYPLDSVWRETFALMIVRQVLFGLSIGPQMVGSFTSGSADLRFYGYDSSDVTVSTVFSSIFNTGWALGSVSFSLFSF